jgi:hypothetical protein
VSNRWIECNEENIEATHFHCHSSLSDRVGRGTGSSNL